MADGLILLLNVGFGRGPVGPGADDAAGGACDGAVGAMVDATVDAAGRGIDLLIDADAVAAAACLAAAAADAADCFVLFAILVHVPR